jgi:hypothetical protein
MRKPSALGVGAGTGVAKSMTGHDTLTFKAPNIVRWQTNSLLDKLFH